MQVFKKLNIRLKIEKKKISAGLGLIFFRSIRICFRISLLYVRHQMPVGKKVADNFDRIDIDGPLLMNGQILKI